MFMFDKPFSKLGCIFYFALTHIQCFDFEGTRFTNKSIYLGEMEVAQVTTFQKVWSFYEGGKISLGIHFL
jgi:hypothetical protein